ncbi:MAG TPA: hypothetical protein DCG28_01770 [Lachnospiraceae bacterium]|nr:hypothetical protein [Lachnospiraceae bacterium]
MMKRLFLFFVLCANLFILTVHIQAAVISNNAHKNNYTTYGSTTKSYLYEQDGFFYRVEYISGSVWVEKYTLNGEYVSLVKQITPPLSLFGAFYSGSEYNYLVFGEPNKEESTQAEVIRVEKYTKNWQYISSGSGYGLNTYIPFDAGNCSVTEYDGTLYVFTCHTMFKSSDGYNHQSNMLCIFNEEDMSLSKSSSAFYSSHSFRQSIETDGTYLFALDHGDAYPRSLKLSRSTLAATSVTSKDILAISGETGANSTGVSVSDMLLSSDKCFVVYNSVEMGDDYSASGQRNIYVAIADKTLSKVNTVQLTDYTADDGIKPYTPYIIANGDGNFSVLWEEYNGSSYTVKIKIIDQNGTVIKSGENHTVLSDCKPVCINGTLWWYTASNSEPCFYSIKLSNLESTPSPLEAYTFDSTTGTLSINGVGAVPADGPWSTNKENIKNIIIGNNITGIASSAFKEYTALETLSLGSKLGSVGSSAFNGCTSLKTVKAKSISSIESSAFAGCTALETFEFPENLTSLGSSAFDQCSSLQAAILPDSVTSLGGSCFGQCNKLKTVRLSKNIKTINSMTFYGTSSLDTIEIPYGITSVGYAAFWSSGIKAVTIPTSVTSIGSRAFSYCYYLKLISVPDTVTNIASDAFSYKKTAVYCFKDSSAEEFAVNNSMTVKYIGDVDENGTFDAADSSLILKNNDTADAQINASCDINCDGKTDILDAIASLK